jgi:hypothetical protein
MTPEVGSEFIPSDSIWGSMSINICIPPSSSSPLESSCSIQDLLSVATLRGGEHLQPILSLKWISCMGEHWGWWLMNSWCLLSGAGCCTGGLLTWACSWPQCWSSSQGAESGSGKTAAWPDPFVLAVVLGLNGCFSLDGSLPVDQLGILT